MSEPTELIIRAVGIVGKTDGTLVLNDIFYIGSGPATGTYRIDSIETQESDPHSKIMGAAKQLGWGIAIPHGEPESTILGYSIGTDEYLAAVDGNKAKVDQLREANEDLETQVFALGLQKAQLEELGTDATLIKQRDACQAKMMEAVRERNAAKQETQALRDQLTGLVADWREVEVERTHGSGTRAVKDCRDCAGELTETLSALGEPAPIDMLLFCPRCGAQHVDAPDPNIGWDCPPHRSHLCHVCKCVFRPADVPTNGVAAIQTRGKADTWDGFRWPDRVKLPD
jgi:hypothetical protein